MPAPQVAAAQRSLAAVLRPGDRAVDATAGNGHDTEFLARRVGAAGRVVAVDAQAAAVAATDRRLRAAELGDRVALCHAGHEGLAALVPPSWTGRVRGVVFNLGYLPGSDANLITRPATTRKALDGARHLLEPGGRLAVVAYPGHGGGLEEAEAVATWAASATRAGDRVLALGRWRRGVSQRAPRLTVIERSWRSDEWPELVG